MEAELLRLFLAYVMCLIEPDETKVLEIKLSEIPSEKIKGRALYFEWSDQDVLARLSPIDQARAEMAEALATPPPDGMHRHVKVDDHGGMMVTEEDNEALGSWDPPTNGRLD